MNTADFTPDLRLSFRFFIRLTAVIPLIFGTIVLIGWMIDAPLLKSILPGAVQMKANTAIGLISSGFALYCATLASPSHLAASLGRFVPPYLGLAISLLGAATLGEYVFGWRLGIDELLFADNANAYNVMRGRMSPYTAAAFAVLGVAFILFRRGRWRQLAAAGAVFIVVIGMLALLGYFWNASELVTDRWLPPVAVNTALAFILLGAGLLCVIYQPRGKRTMRLFSLATVEAKVLAGFIAGLALLAVSGGATYRTIAQFSETAQWFSLTSAVQVGLEQLNGSLSAAQVEAWRYTRSGDIADIRQCKQKLDDVLARLEELDRLVEHEPERQSNFARLAAPLNEANVRLAGLPAALPSPSDRAGAFDALDRADAVLDGIENAEHVRLKQREAALVTSRESTLASLLFTLLIAVISFMMLFYRIRLEMVSRNAASKALMLAKDEADAANRAKSTFLATMSHEIRTPMNAVLGMVELLELTPLEASQRVTLEVVQESGKSLLGIIDDILDFSKIEAGKLEISLAPASVHEIVEGLCNSLLPVAARRGIDLSLFVSPDIPEQVLADDGRLRQVLYNLIGNALKFSEGRMGRRGHVAVRVETDSSSPLRLIFTVADNGIGMAPETLARIFTPFTQAEVSTTRRFGGTGLGLAICKRLADLMRGGIEVESETDKGSTFRLTLPFDVPEVQPTRDLPDLGDLDCILLQHPEFPARDLCMYLKDAGARTYVIDEAERDGRGKKTGARTILIRYAGRQDPAEATLTPHARFANTRRLLISRAQERAPQEDGGEIIALNVDSLRRKTFLHAVAIAAGRIGADILRGPADHSKLDGMPRPTLSDARAQGRLILVAEDDPINQKVILQQLAALGYAAEIAKDGADALRMWRAGNYALVLTDLHMPGVDGYMLTRQIREEENGARRIPILALTANALHGEARRAHEAGMDQYLTKPIQLRLLKKALENWLPASSASSSSSASPAPEQETQDEDESNKPAVIDMMALANTIGDDAQAMKDLLMDYLNMAIPQAGEMTIAFTSGDQPYIASVAHKLKSSSRAIGAMMLGDLCAEIENTVKAGNDLPTAEFMPRFEAAVTEVKVAIFQILAVQPRQDAESVQKTS